MCVLSHDAMVSVMRKHIAPVVAATLLMVSSALAQNPPAAPPAGTQDGRQGRSNNPFRTPIPTTEGVINVNFVEFASIPDAATDAARVDLIADEPGTGRLFVN